MFVRFAEQQNPSNGTNVPYAERFCAKTVEFCAINAKNIIALINAAMITSMKTDTGSAINANNLKEIQQKAAKRIIFS